MLFTEGYSVTQLICCDFSVVLSKFRKNVFTEGYFVTQLICCDFIVSPLLFFHASQECCSQKSTSLPNLYVVTSLLLPCCSFMLRKNVVHRRIPSLYVVTLLPPCYSFMLRKNVVHIRNVVHGKGDPDITSDFIVPPNNKIVDGKLFTYTGMRGVFDNAPETFKVTKASMAEFPAVNGQSVSFAVLQYPAGAINPPHTHPRSAELLFLVEGSSLEVGFVDTSNKLYTQKLQVGDMFVFPKGLVHYQFNPDPKKPATAISAFGSASAGTVSVPGAIFTTGIEDDILAKAFKTDVATIKKIKAGLAPKA
ncbi:hypothetical protein HHK36_011426 [Tetracentron sinense]|uniref:Cupin type-1 domain-containing protein n=1 Tax=Tetracentron sinense TaxID=13715 RepID=A0A835DKE8_TETSI|nr:hypothetical protein HHK36_011426 [Tetracentron sinense]